MGIPFYFREIVQNNKNILGNLNRCNRLYLDYNSIIHVASQKVVSSKVWKDYQQMEKAITQHIIEYTHDVVKSCQPDQLLYIGIDGVAPIAKMIQQRKRRHLSSLQSIMINDFKSRNNIPYTSIWDSNCITPGTDFMFKLNQVLKAHFASLKTPFETIISGPDEVGEGEHKIIRYIKSLGDDKCVDVIYGLDADLIMLTMTCHKDKLYLMRESTQLTNDRNSPVGYKFVNIDVLRKSVGDYLYTSTSTSTSTGNTNMYMYDYVFICFILGNDFLPHFLCVDIKHEGLQMICDIYRKLHHDHNEYLILKQKDKFIINLPFLKIFFKELVRIEDEIIKRNIKIHYESPYNERRAATPLEKFMNDLNYMPLIKRKKIIDPENDPFWKTLYYKTFLNITSTDMKAVDDICCNYLQGLQWNIDYYFNNKSTNTWYYNYATSPFISDVYRFLNKADIPSTTAPDTLIEDREQLLLVLPHKSFPLLPPSTRERLKDISQGYVYLYPTSFQVITFMKSQLWECIPILPPVNIKLIKEFYKTQ